MIDEFVRTAKEYCSLIENHEQLPPPDFLHRIRKILPQLYHGALRLPPSDGSEEKLDRGVSHEEWSRMFGRLRRHLGDLDLYWQIYDPVKKEADDPVASSLSDDFADIWRELKNGLSYWDNASATMRDEIVWQWSWSAMRQHKNTSFRWDKPNGGEIGCGSNDGVLSPRAERFGLVLA